jgi:entericidin A
MKSILALLATAVILAGCNTMRGFGQDVQKVGDKIEGAASKK